MGYKSEKQQIPEGFTDLGEDIKSIAGEVKEETSESPSVYYPCLHFSGKDGLKDLPESGTALIHYKKIMERETTTTNGGEKKTQYSVELEIHGIKPVKGEKSEAKDGMKSPKDDEDAIDKGLEAASQETSND